MSAVADEKVTFYWVPGCGNCTRLKGYLSSRKLRFESVNVQADVDAFEDMQRAGHRTLPALRKGAQFLGFNGDLRRVDDFLGLPRDVRGRDMSPEELVERSAKMLDLSAYLAEQLPPEHYDDPTPTMDGFEKPSRFMSDGAPYIPHGTYKSLVHHIAQHGEKAARIILASDGYHELGFAVDGTGDYNFFGEPEACTPMYRVAGRMRLTAKDLRAWLLAKPTYDFSQPLATHKGMSTLQKFLEVQTISMVQHARQLEEVLENRLGIKPVDTVEERDLEGLIMPSGTWE